MRAALAVTAFIMTSVLSLSGCASLLGGGSDLEKAAESLVSEFLHHVEAGEAEEALALTDTDIESIVNNKLVTNRVYRKVTNRPTEVAVARISESGTSGVLLASIRYTIGGEINTDMLRVAGYSPDDLVITLEDGSGLTREIKAPTKDNLGVYFAGEMVINSTTVVTEHGQNGTVSEFAVAFPGDYTVEYHDALDITEVPKQAVRVTKMTAKTEVKIDPIIKAKANQELVKALSVLVDDCTANGAIGLGCLGDATHEPERWFAQDIVITYDPVATFNALRDGTWQFTTSSVGGSPGTATFTHVLTGERLVDHPFEFRGKVERDARGGMVLLREDSE